MMSADDRALEDLLYGADLGDLNDLGDEADGAGPEGAGPEGAGPEGGSQAEESAAVEDTSSSVSVRDPMTCAGCGEQVCDRFFLLAAGCAWHAACLRCSRCRCELQAQPSLFWRDGSVYCQQDYCRMFGGGQCARCFQPIPASALVMRSGELTFHPHCFSCQECDVTLLPGNLYCLQGRSLYCQSHYGDGSVPVPRDAQPYPGLKEAQHQLSGEGEESVSSPEPRLDDRAAGGRTRRRTKRIRTCFRSEQLRALESYFAQKHNPDGKDWNCLAHKTGLPKRVLQVWFQNARAKLRRSVTTDDSQVDSPSAPPGEASWALGAPGGLTGGPSPPPDRPLAPPPSSTIDQLQLSLLTAPLGEPAGSPAFYPDYDSQSAPGGLSSLEAYEDFEEAGGGAEGGVDPHSPFRPHYC
ncbi:LIM/homeobox protein Awh-like [Clinocottus analis]|uniref:LIM/homeobox protein Awh-like n=1 Tax=Clinocottus analis TaxID=304258 RepID=UPI0035C2092B